MAKLPSLLSGGHVIGSNGPGEVGIFYLAPMSILCAECGAIVMAGPPLSGAIGQQCVFCPNIACTSHGKVYVIELDTVGASYTGTRVKPNALGQWIPQEGITVNKRPDGSLIAMPSPGDKA